MDFFSSASVVVMVGVGFGASGSFFSAGFSLFGVVAFFSVAVEVVVVVGGAVAGVTVGAFSFSGLALTRHFSGSSKAAFSSWSSSPDLAAFRDRFLRCRRRFEV